MSDYILIQGVEDFLAIQNDLGARYKLTTDLDFSGVLLEKFIITDAFNGELNGNGFALKNAELAIAPSDRQSGIFERFGPDAIVHNLHVEGLKISVPQLAAPTRVKVAFCGLVYKSRARAIFNCHIKNMQVKINANAGMDLYVMGLAYSAQAGNGKQGGIRECSVTGMDIEANQWVSVFGLVAEKDPDAPVPALAEIRDCYVGPVTRYPEPAQVNKVELLHVVPTLIKNCYLASEQGWFDLSDNVVSCYCDSELGLPSTNQYARSTQQMKQRATYVDWDFDKVWSIDEGAGYPALRGETAYVSPALTAEEYDTLELTAQKYDCAGSPTPGDVCVGLTAHEYDTFGKLFLP